MDFKIYQAIVSGNRGALTVCLEDWEKEILQKDSGSPCCRTLELMVLLSQRCIRAGHLPLRILALNEDFLPRMSGCLHFEEIRGLLFQYIEELCGICSECKRQEKHELAERAARFIEENCSSHITIREVANRLYVSESRLRDLLKSEFGSSFKEIQIRSKMDRARNLLLSQECNMADVARLLGFTDASHFCKTFRRTIGQTPNQFRNRALQVPMG